MTTQRKGQGQRDVGKEDLTRVRQYQGVDPSGYERSPQATEGHEENGAWREESPGNYGECGGRWHDHEGPYSAGRTTVGYGIGEVPGDACAQTQTGFRDRAQGLYPDPATGRAAYGGGGREGYDASVVKRAPDAEPEGADARLQNEARARVRALEDVDTNAIVVTAREGHVVLDGTVATPADKRAVEDAVAAIAGVRDVVNQLHVQQEPS